MTTQKEMSQDTREILEILLSGLKQLTDAFDKKLAAAESVQPNK